MSCDRSYQHRETSRAALHQVHAIGDPAGGQKVVRYFFIGSRRYLQALANVLLDEGLKAQPCDQMLIVREIVPLISDRIEERTAQLDFLARGHRVEFDGWEIGALDDPEVDPDAPPPGSTWPVPGEVHALPLPNGRFGYVHVLGIAKTVGTVGNVLTLTTEAVERDLGRILAAPPLHRQPVFLTPHLWMYPVVGSARPNSTAANAQRLLFKAPHIVQTDLLFERLVQAGLIDLKPTGPMNVTPEFLSKHRNRECAFLSSLEPLPYSNWKLFSYTIHKTGKLKQLSEEIVSADDPRLREAYPFQQFMYLEDIGAALGAGGWDTHAIYDRLYSPLQRHPGQTDECT
jgi:hypothetical protein